MARSYGTQVRGWKWLIGLGLFLASLGLALSAPIRGEAAPASAPPGPDRFSVSTVDYTRYFWWLIYIGESDHECEIEIDHEGLPTPGDIYVDCGEDLYEKWIKNKPCLEADTNLCIGHLYLQLMNTEPAQKQVSTILPPPTVQVTLENCSPVYSSSTSICDSEPILLLTGIEPLPGYQIISIEGLYEGQPFVCGAVCRLQLPVTGENIFTLQFWANSSYGDSSELFDARIRVALTNAGDPDRTYWYVDVLSDQWAGVPVASCVQTWGTLPPIGGPPGWLSTPPNVEALNTDVPYTYLSAQLIKQGAVDVSACPDGGLNPDETASTCGIEVARPAVTAWQNQFDEIILNVARDTGVPANLLKRLFSIESQFWPGASNKTDIGLGQLTPEGADTTLMWNPPFFRQFCPLVMDSTECSKGYLQLTDEQQEYLRLALFDAVNPNCEACPLGIDLDRANFSIGVFAHTLLANCEQAGQLVENVTAGQPAGQSASFEDLWKFTMVNYNAGPGCLGDALDVAVGDTEGLIWENVASHLLPTCPGAVNYVEQISR